MVRVKIRIRLGDSVNFRGFELRFKVKARIFIFNAIY